LLLKLTSRKLGVTGDIMYNDKDFLLSHPYKNDPHKGFVGKSRFD